MKELLAFNCCMVFLGTLVSFREQRGRYAEVFRPSLTLRPSRAGLICSSANKSDISIKGKIKPHQQTPSKNQTKATLTWSLFLKDAAACQQQLWVLLFRSKSCTDNTPGASERTVPARQTLGREPAFHLSFTLLPQIMDLESTVNIQTQ